ncbi:hypothetical protein [Flavobacterium aquicola]|uniref:Uncharacterized protein n=1 Tax=Flavobacterium aquicola TaxID=1682742 RepID=A0A3E0EMM2_9FLAO|nr:hypothetical protein [Flavobacterium aquicola]REG99421.1 hypothetical protein C8P67_10438 [Flavobacterium aquicola]
MIKGIQFVMIALFFIGCKSNPLISNVAENNEPSLAYKQQIENLEKGFYFRGNGNEPDWSLKISEKTIKFTSLKQGYETLTADHAEPIRAMDASVKMYRVPIVGGTMIIQIMQ